MGVKSAIVQWYEEGDDFFIQTEDGSLERWVIRSHVPIRAEEEI